METLLIRKLDGAIKLKLRIRAAEHGHSMEEEAREILRRALTEPEEKPITLAQALRRRAEAIGGIELDLPPREPAREPPDFSGPDFGE